MKREPVWRRYLRFWGPSPEQDVSDEFAFHISAKIDELVESGMSLSEARAEAARRFGPSRQVYRQCHEIARREQQKASWKEWILQWRDDVSYALRTLGRSKGPSAAALLLLSVGIGANIAVFTLLDRLLYRPLGVPKPGQLLMIANPLRYSSYTFLRDNARSFTGLALNGGFRIDESKGKERIADPATVYPVSGNYFEVMQVRAQAGRTFTSGDDRARDPQLVAVASEAFMLRRYGRAENAIGETVFLEQRPFTIIGVLPGSFTGTAKSDNFDLYIPIAAMAAVRDYSLTARDSIYSVFARIRPGVDSRAAEQELRTLWKLHVDVERAANRMENPLGDPLSQELTIGDGAAGRPGLGGDRRRSLELVGGVVLLLLLMSCVNVGCLLLARSAARHQEFAIRLALGSGPGRLLRHLFLESGILALLGGALGLGIAVVGARLLLAGLRWGGRLPDLSPDARVLLFCFGASMLTGLLCTVAPAIRLFRASRLTQNRQQAAVTDAAGRWLVAAQVAIAVVMVASAAMFLRGFYNLRSVPLGFNPQQVAAVRLQADSPIQDADGREVQTLNATNTLASRLRSDPRFEAVTVGNTVPFGEGSIGYAIQADSGGPASTVTTLRVAGGYFHVMETAILLGREFHSQDEAASPRVVILGESLAKRLFPEGNAVGRQVTIGKVANVTVVGVAGDIKFGNVRTPAPPVAYLPVTQQTAIGGAFMGASKVYLRTPLSLRDVERVVEREIASLRLPLQIDTTLALEDVIGASYFNDRVRMQATAIFGLLALSILAFGLHGLMAYWVAQRTREIGVRIALGSSPAKVLGMVLKQSTRCVIAGLLAGVPLALWVAGALASMIFEAPPLDWISVLAAAAVLLVVGIFAAAVPAWRAAHLDPMRALRVE